jgi:hypothetical protein
MVDLRDKIGGTTESKKKMLDGIDKLMKNDYTNTTNPDKKYVENDVNSPTRLEVNRQNIVAAANFKNKIKKEVPSSHTTPVDSDAGSDID